MYNQHTRGMATTRHRGLVEKGGRKALVEDKDLVHTQNKICQEKTDIHESKEKETSTPSFAGSPRCTFTLTKKLAFPAAILFRSVLMAAARISASSAPTNVAFPPSQIHLLTAFNNDWLPHKYSNGSSISVSRSASKNAATAIQADLSWSPLPHVPLCTAAFFFLLNLLYPAPILPCLSEPSPAVTWP